jgi:hypothetical protein
LVLDRSYRVYRLTGEGHIISPLRVITCDTDEGVIGQARALIDGCGVEVWDGPRRVAVLTWQVK